MTNSAGSSLTADIESPGDKFISSLSKGYTYTIELRYYNPNSDAKGLIWVNPSNNEIKVNLTKKYEWKFDYAKISGAETKLIYAINNSEKKVTFNFKYNSKMKLYDGSTVQIHLKFVMEQIAKVAYQLIILKKENLIKYM